MLEGRTRLIEFIERGYQHLGRQDLLAALAEWEDALRLDPSNERLRESIDFVREHFSELSAFGEGGGANQVALPFSLADLLPPRPANAPPADEPDDDPYEGGLQIDEVETGTYLPEGASLSDGFTLEPAVGGESAPPLPPAPAPAPFGETFEPLDLRPPLQPPSRPRAPSSSKGGASGDFDIDLGSMVEGPLLESMHDSMGITGTGPGRAAEPELLPETDYEAEPSQPTRGGSGWGAITDVPTTARARNNLNPPVEGVELALASPLFGGGPDFHDEDSAFGLRKTDAHEGAAQAGAEAPLDEVRQHLLEARKQFDRGDLAAAAQAASEAFGCDPEGSGATAREQERQLLLRIFETRIGSLRQVPRLVRRPDELANSGFDHRFGFLLDRIDGVVSFEDLLDIAAMPRLDAFRIIEHLLRAGVIAV